MWETIFSWLNANLGAALDVVVSFFLSALEVDVSDFKLVFPVLSTGYTIFRAIGIGIVTIGLSYTFIKYLTGGIADVKEPPAKTIICGVTAAMLIYGGGYFLEELINIAKVPYDFFRLSDASGSLSISAAVSSEGFLGNGEGIEQDFGLVSSLSTGALAILSFAMILLIGFNVFKLILEVAERYVVVAVNVYLCPMYFACFAAPETRPIFKKWMLRFIGGCLLLGISAFFLKAVVSGFSMTGEGTAPAWMRLLLTLAMCKVAQRADSAMRDLGLPVAMTGQNMMTDFMALSKAMSSKLGSHGKGGGSETVLGAAARNTGFTYGGIGMVGDAVKAAWGNYKSGGDAADIAKAAGKAAMAAAPSIIPGGYAVSKAVDSFMQGRAEREKNLGEASDGTSSAPDGANDASHESAFRSHSADSVPQDGHISNDTQDGFTFNADDTPPFGAGTDSGSEAYYGSPSSDVSDNDRDNNSGMTPSYTDSGTFDASAGVADTFNAEADTIPLTSNAAPILTDTSANAAESALFSGTMQASTAEGEQLSREAARNLFFTDDALDYRAGNPFEREGYTPRVTATSDPNGGRTVSIHYDAHDSSAEHIPTYTYIDQTVMSSLSPTEAKNYIQVRKTDSTTWYRRKISTPPKKPLGSLSQRRESGKEGTSDVRG